MWLFTRYGFFSISLFEGKTQVRARTRRHLENLKERFPVLQGCEILVLLENDYRYRISVEREVWDSVFSELGREQTWSNFKNEVGRFGGYDRYERLLHKVWGVMFELQEWEEKDRVER
jgi:hypothetical protein